MALTTMERTNIIKLTVGMFNAAAGATYMADLTAAYEANGRSLAQLARTLTDTAAFKAIHPVFQTAAEFASAILTPLTLQANTTAVDFVTAKFNAGVSKGQIIFDVMVALDATTATEFADAKAILNNKTSVAEYYTVTKAIAQTNVGTLQSVLAHVDKSEASVTTAKDLIDHPAGTTDTSTSTGNTGGTTDAQTTSGSSNSADGSEGTWHYDPVTHTYVMSAMTPTIDVVGVHPLW